MLDIEALSREAGAAIIEIGARAFTLDGTRGEGLLVHVNPREDDLADLDTLAWHRRQGSWPRPHPYIGFPAAEGLTMLYEFVDSLGAIESVWSWGVTYDFPILTAALKSAHLPVPWDYWQIECARTIWRRAFGSRKRDKRSHSALEDCDAAIRDLTAALDALRHPTLA